MNKKGNQGNRKKARHGLGKARHGLGKARHGLGKHAGSSRIKRAVFTVAAVLIPLVLLALAEVALRAGGVMSQRQSLFLPVPQDERYVAVNPRFAGRYFAGFEPDVAPQPFLRDKPAGTRRYFVLGGSSAAGFPYHFYHGFPAYLEEMLQMGHPGERVEVINLAMTAVNSFTLWDIHRELLRHDPDGILIYAGHNEYYGAMGAAAVSWWMRPLAVRRSVLRLQRLHLAAMVTELAERLAGRSAKGGFIVPDNRKAPEGRTAPYNPTAPDNRSTPDNRTIQGNRAMPGSRGNPENRTVHENGAIPDSRIHPDMSDGRTLMARMAEDRLVYREDARFVDGIRHFEKNMGDITDTFLKRGIPVFVSTVVSNKKGQEPLSGHVPAMDYFERAKIAGLDTDATAATDTVARELFLLAKEEDPLRFRAPQAINDAIRRLSHRQGVTLVDAHAIRTGDGAPLPYAPDYFTDHLHLDYRGYGLLAAAFRDAMTAGYQSVLIAPPNPLEKLFVAHSIAVLKSDFPFEREPDRQRPAAVHRERLARYRISDDPVPTALHDHFTGTRPLTSSLAELATHFRTEGQHPEALLTLRALLYRQPLNPDLDALIMDYLTDLAQQGVDVPPVAVIPLWTRLVASAVDHRTWPHAVEVLIENERFEDALRWLQVWERHEPPADFYRLYAMWHIRQDNHREAQPWFREYYRRIR